MKNAFFLCLFYLVVTPVLDAASSSAPWTYSVVYNGQTRSLTVTAELPEGRVILNNDGAAYVAALEIIGDKKTATAETNSWLIPRCAKSLCKLRYSFALGAAAKRAQSRDDLSSVGESILSNPALWLLRPTVLPEGQRVVLRFEAKGGSLYGTGLFPSKRDPRLYETEAFHLSDLPWTLFGPFHARSFARGGSQIDLAIIPAAYKVTEEQIADWSVRATEAVIAYYGALPVLHILIVVIPRDLYKGPGKSFGDGGAATINPLSVKAEEVDLKKDWVMTHEMVHLAFPSVPYQHHWIEEGLATYVEPIARIRSGELKAEDVFADMIDGMAKGLPRSGDKGLDGPPTWGRTYWGGALFCLLADIEIREKSKGRFGLEDALRAVVKDGGTMATSWPLTRALNAGDKAIGLTVLNDLYKTMKDKPVMIDLDALWKKLGVVRAADSSVHFDDKAPLAFVRQGIVSGKSDVSQ